ncbi:MAG: replication factor A protein 2 [Chrysothrix sp. TS-e1954]|nr:MAG: replication factor A protein 2 [Chrysothrix sp. TS-e1954]
MEYGNYGNYSTTSYGAQGPAGGGGFVNSGSQENAGPSKTYGKDSLRPVTIKQINEAESGSDGDSFKIDGADMMQLTFVAQIQNISRQAVNTIYKLDDGTGSVEVKQWIDPDAAAANPGDDTNPSKPKLVENTYARVFGMLKSFGNKRHVGVKTGGIRPIADFNEVQYHLLEATAVHLYFTKGPLGGAKGGEAGQTNGAQTNGGDVSMGGTKKMLPAGLSAAARRVYQCLQSTPQTNEGLHMQEIAGKLGMDMANVGKAGDELLNHGLLYTTMDDNTWALLDDF